MLGSGEFGEATVIADLEAGIGTLTRLGESYLDAVLIVVEPTPKSLEVGARAADLAKEKNLGQIFVVASRIRNDDDLTLVRKTFPDNEVVPIPDDVAIVQADRDGVAPLDAAPDSPAVKALVALAERLVPART